MRRFSSTLRKVNTWRPSGTSTTPARATASASRPSMRRPSNSMLPLAGSITPAMVLSSVVLPAPLAPSTATMRPGPTSRLMPRMALTGPYQVSMLRTLSSAVMCQAPR